MNVKECPTLLELCPFEYRLLCELEDRFDSYNLIFNPQTVTVILYFLYTDADITDEEGIVLDTLEGWKLGWDIQKNKWFIAKDIFYKKMLNNDELQKFYGVTQDLVWLGKMIYGKYSSVLKSRSKSVYNYALTLGVLQQLLVITYVVNGVLKFFTPVVYNIDSVYSIVFFTGLSESALLRRYHFDALKSNSLLSFCCAVNPNYCTLVYLKNASSDLKIESSIDISPEYLVKQKNYLQYKEIHVQTTSESFEGDA